METNKLFVGWISWNLTEQVFEEAFAEFGEVVSVKIIKDRETGKSRGFGFVEYTNTNDSSAAKEAMDGKELDGRTIKVDFAQERT